MAYDQEFFDAYLERRGTRSIKWDGCNEKFGVALGSRFDPGGNKEADYKTQTRTAAPPLFRTAKGEIAKQAVKPKSA